MPDGKGQCEVGAGSADWFVVAVGIGQPQQRVQMLVMLNYCFIIGC
jgi:hypothetical protein